MLALSDIRASDPVLYKNILSTVFLGYCSDVINLMIYPSIDDVKY